MGGAETGRGRLVPRVAAVAAALAIGAAAPLAQTPRPPPQAETPPPPPPAAPAPAEPRISLIADSIAIDREARTVTAEGNVEVHYEGRVLRATRIVYSDADETIRADGPLVLTDPEIGVAFAEAATLTADLREGVIASARLLLDGDMQLGAAELRRSEGRYTTLHRGIASTCEVCPGDAAPTWAIRAERIVRDEETMQIHVRNARLEVFGLPVLWLPYLRVPDATVERASGFLSPSFAQSSIYGFGIKTPYYLTLGPHADATLTPFATTRGGTLLEGEYRRRFVRGGLDLAGVVVLDDRLEGDNGRGTIAALGYYDLGEGFRAELDAQIVSDDDFLSQYDYSDADRLTSVARIARVRAEDRFQLGAIGYQSLRPDEDSALVPQILPELSYRRIWQDALAGGRLGLVADSVGVLRTGGQDVLRVGGGGDWRRDWTVGPGLLLAASTGADFDLYAVRDTPGEPDSTQARAAPWGLAELRWPLVRTGARTHQVIEPVAVLAWADTVGDENVPNEDSQLPEFDENNLFALDRFPGRDRVETGLRANLGVNWSMFDGAGRSATATFGRVLRFSDFDQFPESTGLDGRASDWVGAVEVALGPGLSAINRIRFDDGFDIERNDFSLVYDTINAGLSASWTYLTQVPADDELGPQPEISELRFAGRYRFLRNWQIRGDWRYDLVGDASLRAGGGITYGNECAEIDLSVSRRFVDAGDVPPATSVGFVVRLVGLGGGRASDWPRRSCNG